MDDESNEAVNSDRATSNSIPVGTVISNDEANAVNSDRATYNPIGPILVGTVSSNDEANGAINLNADLVTCNGIQVVIIQLCEEILLPFLT